MVLNKLDSLVTHIRTFERLGSQNTWSDWWGLAAKVLAVLYLMRGHERGTVDEWLDRMLGPDGELRRDVQWVLRDYDAPKMQE